MDANIQEQLIAGIRNGNCELISDILSKGADPNIPDEDGDTPLYFVCKHGLGLELIDILIRAGAKTDVPSRKNDLPLHLSIRIGRKSYVEELLKHNADPNKVSNGEIPIFLACWYDISSLLPLVRFGADTNAGRNSETISEAIKRRGTKFVKIFKNIISEKKFVSTISNLTLQEINKLENGKTKLHIACENDFAWGASVLLSKGADPDITDEKGNTALLIACCRDLETSSVLIQAGADVNTPNSIVSEFYPIHASIQSKRHGITKELLKNGANPSVTLYKLTPIMLACAFEGGWMSILKLISSGADPNVKTENGSTAMGGAIKYGFRNNIRVLLEKGDSRANLEVFNNLELSRVKKRKDGTTLLHIACEVGREDIVSSLLSKDADPNLISFRGETPLSVACGNGHKHLIGTLISAGADINVPDCDEGVRIGLLHVLIRKGQNLCVREILEFGANVNKKSKGLTPLMVACESVSSLESVKYLVQYGANPHTKDWKGETVIQHVIKKGEPYIEVLESALREGIEKGKITDSVSIRNSIKDLQNAKDGVYVTPKKKQKISLA